MDPKCIPIDDVGDSRLRPYSDLRRSRSASPRVSDPDLFVVEGQLVVKRLIESDFEVESLLVQQGKEADYLQLVNPDTPVYLMQADQIGQLVGFEFHRGVLACGKRKTPGGLDVFQQTINVDPTSRLSLGLFGISEQENMGSILRSAAGLGVTRVLLGPRTIDPFSRRVIRVSMANVFRLQFFRIEHSVAELQKMKNMGVQIIGSSLDDGAMDLRSIDVSRGERMILVGNEAHGLDREIQQIVDLKVQIPMCNNVDSLNAAAATAILMYHLNR